MTTDTLTIAGPPRFAMVPCWVISHPDLHATAKAVYSALLFRAGTGGGTAWPSYQRLADDVGGVHRDTARRAVDALQAAGALTVTARHTDAGDRTSNAYTLQWQAPTGHTCSLCRNSASAAVEHGHQVQPSTGATPPVQPRTDPSAPVHPPPSAPVHPELYAVELDPKNNTMPADAGDDADDTFALFWQLYPPTNGRKPEKARAAKAWRKLTLQQRRDAYRGARHLATATAAGTTIPKYAHRYLAHHAWVDWQEPVRIDRATGTATPAPTTQPYDPPAPLPAGVPNPLTVHPLTGQPRTTTPGDA